MKREIATLVLALVGLVSSVRAAGLPVCPGCEDCSGDCLAPGCRCAAPIDDDAARALLDYAQQLLSSATEGRMDLARPVRVQVADPEALLLPDGEQALATCIRERRDPSYGHGVRNFLEWERTLGVVRLLELARTWNDFARVGLREER